MKKAIFTGVFLIAALSVAAQNRANNWYFGKGIGLSFEQADPTPLYGSNMEAVEACASISDLNGNLLFYTDGVSIFNRNAEVMSGGSGIKGSKNATQGALIIPRPGHPNLYYLFTIADSTNNANNLFVTEVNMALNNGMGGIGEYKNYLLRTGITERLAATFNPTAGMVWLMCQSASESAFHAYSIGESGFSTNPVTSNVGQTTYNWGAYVGQMKFSPNGAYLAWVSKGDHFTEVFSFNINNGELSSASKTISYGAAMPYGVEFSPDASKLYVSVIGKGIYQYDMSMFVNQVLFENSQFLLATSPVLGLQLAPDGRIYAAVNFGNRLHAIESPNNQGSSAGFVANKVVFSGGQVREGLPPFIADYFTSRPILSTNACAGESTLFTFVQDLADSVVWTLENKKMSGIIATHVFSSPGTYVVKARIYSGIGIDSFQKSITVNARPEVDLGPDTVICAGTQLLLNPGVSQAAYRWQDGSSTPVHLVSETGTYTVTVTKNGCSSIDTMVVQVDNPKVDIVMVQNGFCEDDNEIKLSVDQDDQILSAQWDLGNGFMTTDMVFDYEYSAGGTYEITLETINSNFCKATDQVEVKIGKLATASIGSNAVYQCLDQNSFELVYDQASLHPGLASYTFELSDGSTYPGDATHTFAQPGEYTARLITLTNEGCMDRAEIGLTVFPNPQAAFVIDSTQHCLPDNEIRLSSVSGSANGPIIQYLYTSGNLYSTDPQTKFVYPVAGNYSIRLEVIDDHGCRNSSVQEVRIHARPVADFNLLMDGNCAGTNPISTENLSASVPGDELSYQWDFGNGETSADFEPVFNYKKSSTYTVTLRAISDKGCEASVQKVVTSYESPVVDFEITTMDPCLNENKLSLQNMSSIATGEQLFYQWNIGGAIFRTRDIAEYRFDQSGIHTIELTVLSERGCMKTLSRTVEILPSPLISIQVNDAEQCLRDNAFVARVDALVQPSPIVSMTWNSGAGQEGSASEFQFSYQQEGLHQLSLVLTNQAGCSAELNSFVQVHPQPAARFESEVACQNAPLEFASTSVVNSGEIVSWYWDFGDGQSAETENPVHVYSEPGEYPVYLEVSSDKGCKDYHFSKVKVWETAPAKFTHKKYRYDADKQETVYEFASFAVPAGSQITWYLNGVKQGTGPRIFMGFKDTGSVDVTMMVSVGAGCPSVDAQRIFVAPPFELYVPNAFTPNGDGHNDVFFPVSNCYIHSYNMIVVNRWGSVVYSSKDLNQGWDGYFSGSVAEPGNYIYYIQVVDIEGEKHVFKGNFLLLK